MNTSQANLNPASAVQAQTSAGKAQDSAADTPFSQVLSSEMAQNQRGGQTVKTEKSRPGTDETTEAVDPAASFETPAVKTESVQIAAAFDMLRADTSPVSPEVFLALALPPSQAQADPGKPDDAMPGDPAALAASMQTGAVPQNGLPSKAPTAEQLRTSAAGSQKTDITQLGTSTTGPKKADAAQLGALAGGSQKTDSALSARAASEFTGQLAAAGQSDSMKTGEQLSELMANPIMRATPHAPVEAPTPTSGAAAARLDPSVGTTAWGQALGEKIVWMAAGAQQTASLTLNPPNLGPLQIVLNISNEQATASFFSAQPEVRQALEAAFPRLREMMNEAGIQLGQATVSADTPQQQAFDQQSQRVSHPFSGLGEPTSEDLQAIQAPVLRSGRGLIDTFA